MSLALRTSHRDPFQLFFGGAQAPAFAPAFQVIETADAFVVTADLPGVAEADLDIAVHQDVLTVAGHRKAPERKDGEKVSLVERAYGSFARKFSLPEVADGEKIEARLEAGVLTLTIAKKAAPQPRKIALKH